VPIEPEGALIPGPPTEHILNACSTLVETWLARRFGAPTSAQARAWPLIAEGKDCAPAISNRSSDKANDPNYQEIDVKTLRGRGVTPLVQQPAREWSRVAGPCLRGYRGTPPLLRQACRDSNQDRDRHPLWLRRLVARTATDSRHFQRDPGL
jgi:hypothetical protein